VATNAIGEFPIELRDPATNRLTADDDPTRGAYFFDHPLVQWKSIIQPNGKADRLRSIVYSAEGNPKVGASSMSGLVVMRGSKAVSNRPCSRFTAFDMPGRDFFALPEDTDAYSAL
jgi:hypothetical protein